MERGRFPNNGRGALPHRRGAWKGLPHCWENAPGYAPGQTMGKRLGLRPRATMGKTPRATPQGNNGNSDTGHHRRRRRRRPSNILTARSLRFPKNRSKTGQKVGKRFFLAGKKWLFFPKSPLTLTSWGETYCKAPLL